jgi:hypothetical protein
VPLQRPGFRPQDAYEVSFVYLHAAGALQKRGLFELALPRFDVPVGLLEWELFLPERYATKIVGGNVLAAELAALAAVAPTAVDAVALLTSEVAEGMLIGRVTDAAGAPLPGATILLEGAAGRRTAVADRSGTFAMPDVPAGPVTVTAQLQGFASVRRAFVYDRRPRRLDFSLPVGALSETVTVTSEAPVVVLEEMRQGQVGAQQATASVLNLQRRVAGVLPVRIDVPRAGMLHRFVRPLVIDEETTVSFEYKRR